jgi:lipoprotein Spr
MKALLHIKRIRIILLAVVIAFPTVIYQYSHASHNTAPARTGAATGGEKAKSKRIHLTPQKIPSRSLPVLRKYLPQYVDIHQAEFMSPEDAYIPIKPSFDPTSPFIDPDMRFKLIRTIGEWLGTRYRYGGTSKRGLDCSGFVEVVMSDVLGEHFGGTSRAMAGRFSPIHDTDSLQIGDLIFFSGTNWRSQRIGHVGIYVGNGVFAHSSTGRGVIYTPLSSGKYMKRFRWGGRFVSDNPPVREISYYRYVQ